MAEKPKEVYGVLPKKYGGGPHGIGDPNDKSLRKVEKDICIPQKMRERTRNEKCIEEYKAFSDCCRENGFFMVFQCRKENTAMQDCYTKWYKDEDFIKECTNQYLEERSEYRRTGLTKKQRAFSRRMEGSL